MAANFVKFWGVRGSYPAPFETHLKTGGNTSCVEIRVGKHVVVCDAGTGIIPFGNALVAENAIQDVTVILTHYHWDHISGLPFFVPAFTPGRSISFFGPGETKREMESHISDQMKAPYFPVETETWLAQVNYMSPRHRPLVVGSMTIDPFNVHHPGSTFGYRIQANGKTIVYASDNELSFINQSIEKRKGEFDENEQELLEAMKQEEHGRAIEFMKGVDLLIHDAQYTPEDYEKKRGWGHSCFVDTVNAAVDAQVKVLYLFHLDPNYDDAFIEKLHEQALQIVKERGSTLVCHVAREGLTVDLDD